MEITKNTSKMSSEQEEHGVQAKRAFKEYPLGTDTEDGIPISKFKEHGGKKTLVGQMQGQEEAGQEIEDEQPEQQDTKSRFDYFNHFHVIKPRGRHEYELDCSRPSKVMPPFIEQILKNMTKGSSTDPKNEILRIFQDIVTSPESVIDVLQMSRVTYVFMDVESSTDIGFTVTPEPSPQNVLALIYYAQIQRFVLVLEGEIEELKKWINEILKTVFDMILSIYRKVNPQGITDVPCIFQKILEALCSDAFDSVLRDSRLKTNISKWADKDKWNKSPPVQAMEEMSIANGSEQQQQPPESVEVDLIQNQGSEQQQQPPESVEVDLIQNQGSEQRQQPPESVEVPLRQNRGEPDKPQKDTGISGKFQNSKIISDE